MMWNKILGSLVGFAIGDAMGATTEFMSEKDIKKTLGQVTDIVGGGWLNLKAGEVTDDTQMTLCVCEAIEYVFGGLEENVNPELISQTLDRCCENFVDWYKTNPKDVGCTCSRVISFGTDIPQSSFWHNIADDPDALGNGSLMRTMPIVLSGLGCQSALLQGRLTHNNIICDSVIKRYYEDLEMILDNGECTDNAVLMEPTGHVVNTLNNALYWTQNTKTFEDAIVSAVNHGGDADTIAAITGSLVGAKYGFDAIPSRWIAQLDSDVLEKMKKYAKIFEKVCTNTK